MKIENWDKKNGKLKFCRNKFFFQIFQNFRISKILIFPKFNAFQNFDFSTSSIKISKKIEFGKNLN